MRTIEDIITLTTERMNALGPLHAKMGELEDVVYGRVALPRNELDPDDAAAVPNLIARGLNQLAQRVASTTPMPVYSPVEPGKPRSEQRARDRRDVTLGWWHVDELGLKRRKRARHLLGYATSPVQVKANLKERRPQWVVRRPREALPAPTDGMVPDDCIFVYSQPASWVRKSYPGALGFLQDSRRDTAVRLVEYNDAEQVTLVATGTTEERIATNAGADWAANWYFWGSNGYSTNWAVRLTSYPNRCNRPLVVAPWSISLDDPQGVFEQSLGLYLKQARLMALEEMAIEQGIFPEPWLEPTGPQTPQVMIKADGRSGTVGVVKDGKLQFRNVNPGFAALQAIDRYERAIRVTSGIPADFGGESANNIRTGVRGENIVSATVDMDVMENQELLAASQEEEDKIAASIDKAYFSGSKPINVAWRGARSARNYDAATTWETDEHTVNYSMVGSDANAATVRLAQLVGTGLLSQQSARELHPDIADAEVEKDRTVAEGIMAALLSSIQTQAADPAGPYQPDDLAYLADLVITNKVELPAAIMRTQERAARRQATSGPVGAPDGPAVPGSPESQPGLSPPGVGMETPAAIPEVGASQSNLSALLNSLRTTRTSISAAQAGAA